jgi:hypothetical protein
MIKIIFAFVVLCILFFLGIKLAQKMTGKEALALTKIVGYSILCSVLSMAVLISIVVIF